MDIMKARQATSCCSTGSKGAAESGDLSGRLHGNCSCQGRDCCSPEPKKRKIVIDFLFLDLNVCTRCQGTETSLDEALGEVAKVLEATGVEVVLNKINVINEEVARQYKFISSPTIRVNGHDIQMDVKESLCESCGDLCSDEVDCRVWTFQGKDYNVPPKAMIIEALLKEVYGGGRADEADQAYVLPDNLIHFYAAMKAKQKDTE